MTEEKQEKKDKKVEQIFYNKRCRFEKNPVNIDNICKEVNVRERNICYNWFRKYNCLTRNFLDMVLKEECKKAGLPTDTFNRQKETAITRAFTFGSVSPIPKTSSAMIGWRSSRAECNLEFTGKLCISLKNNIEPPIKPGEFRVTNQKFIFLG
ncbi:uncharacterized protein [Prorops nasuta]|uniref:uncharacterized protein n=1 Tax=Prorops nasuta TaxID=863751 RepID=UPI0034CF8C38